MVVVLLLLLVVPLLSICVEELASSLVIDAAVDEDDPVGALVERFVVEELDAGTECDKSRSPSNMSGKKVISGSVIIASFRAEAVPLTHLCCKVWVIYGVR